MDNTAKKFFAMLDAPYPGERVNALDMLYDHLQKAGRTFRDILHELETAVAPQQFTDLQDQYNKALQDNAAFNQRYQQDQQELAKLRRQAAALKGAMWIRFNWRPAAGIAALLVGGCFGIQFAFSAPWPDAAAGELRSDVGRVRWEQAAAQSNKPVIHPFGGKPYWMLVRGEVNEKSYVDKGGDPIVMRCLHVYAVPAEADSGQFLAPHPYSLFGFGWLTWPERIVDCRPASSFQ